MSPPNTHALGVTWVGASSFSSSSFSRLRGPQAFGGVSKPPRAVFQTSGALGAPTGCCAVTHCGGQKVVCVLTFLFLSLRGLKISGLKKPWTGDYAGFIAPTTPSPAINSSSGQSGEQQLSPAPPHFAGPPSLCSNTTSTPVFLPAWPEDSIPCPRIEGPKL